MTYVLIKKTKLERGGNETLKMSENGKEKGNERPIHGNSKINCLNFLGIHITEFSGIEIRMSIIL